MVQWQCCNPNLWAQTTRQIGEFGENNLCFCVRKRIWGDRTQETRGQFVCLSGTTICLVFHFVNLSVAIYLSLPSICPLYCYRHPSDHFPLLHLQNLVLIQNLAQTFTYSRTSPLYCLEPDTDHSNTFSPCCCTICCSLPGEIGMSPEKSRPPEFLP